MALGRTVSLSSWDFFTMASRKEIVKTYRAMQFVKKNAVSAYSFVSNKIGKKESSDAANETNEKEDKK